MTVKLKETIKKAEKDKKIKDLRKQGYFLNSGISILKPNQMEIVDWILTYYNLEKDLVVEVLVEKQGIQLKPPAPPLKPTEEELELKDIKVNANEMLDTALEEFRKFKRYLSQIIVTIPKDKKVYFRFNFITRTLEVISVEIDAKQGMVLKSEITPLTKPM